MIVSKMSMFEDRVRFNWGYHDAAQAVSEGWCNEAHNYGFAKYGLLANLSGVHDVVKRHFDYHYAQGWQQGYFDASDGSYEGNSDDAWNRCVIAGTVQAVRQEV